MADKTGCASDEDMLSDEKTMKIVRIMQIE